MIESKSIVAAALVLTGALAGGMAQAGPVDVQWSIVIGSPVYSQPMPVYTQPWPVYGSPLPVYARPWPVYTQPVPLYTQPWPAHARPAPVWVRPAPVHRGGGQWQATRWDRDGDGIPNSADRRYNPRGDRDGDGVRNRHDRHDPRDGGAGRGR